MNIITGFFTCYLLGTHSTLNLTVMGQMHRNNILIYIQQDATDLRHSQHTQTNLNSLSIAADSNNGVTNNKCM
jgi:hypothetical protein